MDEVNCTGTENRLQVSCNLMTHTHTHTHTHRSTLPIFLYCRTVPFLVGVYTTALDITVRTPEFIAVGETCCSCTIVGLQTCLCV